MSKIRYENTIDDIVAFNVAHWERVNARSIKLWRVLIPAAALTAAVIAGLLHGDFSLVIWAAAFSVFFLLIHSWMRGRFAAGFVREQMARGRNEGILCEHEL